MEILEVVSICSFLWLFYLSSKLDKDFRSLNERVDDLNDRICDLEGEDDQMEYESNLIDNFYGTRDEGQKP